MMQDTSYGNFSSDGREFVLTEPLLDRPWMNVLSNGVWCYVASHLGGGYSFLGNPTVGRVSRWHVDGTPRDTVGKFVFLKDVETGRWWNANGYPPTRTLDRWRCHIGLGYNRIVSRHSGIGTEITYFTPMPDSVGGDGRGPADPCLLWMVKLTNRGDRIRRIAATNYVEIALGNWFEDTSWREFYLLFNRQEYKQGVIYTRNTQWVKYLGGWQACNSDANNIPFDHAVFLSSSADVTAYEGDRYAFIGSYRSLENPAALDHDHLRNVVTDGRDACAALQHEFELAPGESTAYVLILGAIHREMEDAGGLIEKYGTVEKATAALDNNRAYWDRVFETPRVETPDGDLNTLTNYWFKYQGANLSWWNRNTGYCYSGIYNFGVRDACQDAVSRLPQDPEWVRQHIAERIMIWQFEDGDWAHGGNFISMQGTRTLHSDDPINPAFILANYVRETGDYSILEEVTPYAHTDGRKSDSIYTHVITGLDFFFSQFGERGLPLILKADWNDALDQMGSVRKGDSVMLAGWAVYCIEQFYICMEYMGDRDKLVEYRQRIARLKQVVNDVAWDGAWYQRGMHDNGWILGTKDNEFGQLWSNPNSFAIVSGIADEDRRAKIYASFEQRLDHELGGYTFYPPFMKPDPRAGIISRFAPGTKENGSIFGHSSRWRVWAECHGGRGDAAYRLLKKMLPTTRHEAAPETYRVEPYVACQFIYGPETDNPGEGSHSWATGTACWTLLNVYEHILGVKPEVEGLRIDPCLPSHWTTAKMWRRFRGADYQIEIRKPAGICRGKVALTVDGESVAGQIIAPHGDGQTHHVLAMVSPG